MTQQELIQQRLTDMGMSWYALARAIGMKDGSMSRFRNGKYQLNNREYLESIAEALTLKLDDLDYAAGRLPPEAHNGLIAHPELLPILRTLLTKVGYLDS